MCMRLAYVCWCCQIPCSLHHSNCANSSSNNGDIHCVRCTAAAAHLCSHCLPFKKGPKRERETSDIKVEPASSALALLLWLRWTSALLLTSYCPDYSTRLRLAFGGLPHDSFAFRRNWFSCDSANRSKSVAAEGLGAQLELQQRLHLRLLHS